MARKKASRRPRQRSSNTSEEIIDSLMDALFGMPQQEQRPPYSIRLPIPRSVPDLAQLLHRSGIKCMYREEDAQVSISDLHSMELLVTKADGQLHRVYIALTGYQHPSRTQRQSQQQHQYQEHTDED